MKSPSFTATSDIIHFIEISFLALFIFRFKNLECRFGVNYYLNERNWKYGNQIKCWKTAKFIQR